MAINDKEYQVFALSPFDQHAPRGTVRWLLCFPVPSVGQDAVGVDTDLIVVNIISQGFRKSLRRWPHLAGKLYPTLGLKPLSQMNINQEVRFKESSLDDQELVSVRKLTCFSYADWASRGMPVQELTLERFSPIERAIHPRVLQLHINIIQGGVLLCLAFNHSVMDGNGVNQFLSHFAQEIKQREGYNSNITTKTKSSSFREHTAAEDSLSRQRLFSTSNVTVSQLLSRCCERKLLFAQRGTVPPKKPDKLTARLLSFEPADMASIKKLAAERLSRRQSCAESTDTIPRKGSHRTTPKIPVHPAAVQWPVNESSLTLLTESESEIGLSRQQEPQESGHPMTEGQHISSISSRQPLKPFYEAGQILMLPHSSSIKFVSTLDCVTALLWIHSARAKLRDHNPGAVSRLFIAVDVRSRMNPPLPSDYMGNAVLYNIAELPLDHLTAGTQQPPLEHVAYVAILIRHTILAVDDDFVQKRLDLFSAFSQRANIPQLDIDLNLDNHGLDMYITSWQTFCGDIDFGDLLGKPQFVRKPWAPIEGANIVLPRCKSQGANGASDESFEVFVQAAEDDVERMAMPDGLAAWSRSVV